MPRLVADPSTDLLPALRRSPRSTTVADHNAYHIGQLVMLRKMLGNMAGRRGFFRVGLRRPLLEPPREVAQSYFSTLRFVLTFK